MPKYEDPFCPYCGMELIDGILYASKDSKNIWLPKSAAKKFRHSLSRRSVEKEGGLIFQSESKLSVLKMEAKVCRQCQIFIGSYKTK